MNRKNTPDLQIMLVSAMGFIGFLTGLFILFGRDIFSEGDKSVFHEIQYEPANIIAPYVRDSVKTLMDRYDGIIDQRRNLGKVANNDSLLIAADRLDTSKVRIKSRLDAYRKLNSLIAVQDSTSFRQLNSMIRFDLSFQKLDSIERVFNHATIHQIDSVNFELVLLSTNDVIRGRTSLPIITFENDTAFFTRYPGVGLWALFIFVFCSFCFASLAVCYHLWIRITRIPELNAKLSSYWKLSILIILLLLIAGWLWNRSFYDGEPIKNILFMKNFNSVVRSTILIGYIAGGICMAGCLYTAGWLSKVEEKLHERDEMTKIYEKLNNIFSMFFTLTATIFTLMVLTTGALYNMIQQLPIVRMLGDDWGFQPAPADFVYLYGGLHSIFLLLIYLPGRWKYPIPSTTAMGKTDSNPKWYAAAKKPFGKLTDILLATSPFLASLIQSLLDELLK